MTLVVHVTTADISLELLLGAHLEAMVAAGYEVVGASGPGPYVAALERRGVRHVALRHATRSMAPLADARALVELTRLFRELRPAVVHTHNPKPGLYGRVAARLAGVPVVVNTVHGLYALPEDPASKRALVYGLERLASACSDAELLQNPEDVAVLRRWRVPAEKVAVLGNGIDLTRFTPDAVTEADAAAARIELGGTGPDDVVVGLVGRLVREKGYPEVFAAAGRLRADHPRVRIAVIGPDEPEKAGALTAAERAAAEAAGVRFLGARDDVTRLYGAMDVHVLASHREGFPRAAMEAAAMGLPIVATDVRGCRQVVEDGVTGLLVPPRDPEALARAIATLVDDPGLRHRMGAAGAVKAAREFDERRCIDDTLATYRRLLRARGLAPPAAEGRSDSQAEGADPRVRLATLADATTLAALHAEGIPDGFLPTLGARFLRLLYRRIVRSAHAFALVVDDADGVAGFVAVATDTRALYREFLRRDLAPGVLAAVAGALRAPHRVWETLRYGRGGGPAGLPAAEILATAVAPRARRTGLGSQLVVAATDALAARGVDAAKVVTASGNAAALRLYQGAGFVPEHTTEVHAGIRQEVLVWR
ncbi:MAG: glycosyltransferase [Acidimicrobiales bacterium]|nr:glycosyltransferase [Acidimicrobiales bacterium]